jgi:hypothetical protein
MAAYAKMDGLAAVLGAARARGTAASSRIDGGFDGISRRCWLYLHPPHSSGVRRRRRAPSGRQKVAFANKNIAKFNDRQPRAVDKLPRSCVLVSPLEKGALKTHLMRALL